MASSSKKTVYIFGGIIVSLLLVIVLILGFTITKQDQVAVDKLNTYTSDYKEIAGIIDEYKQVSQKLEPGNSIDAKTLVDISNEVNEKIVKPTDSLAQDKSLPSELASVVSSLSSNDDYNGILGVKHTSGKSMDIVRDAMSGAGVAEASSMLLGDNRLETGYALGTAMMRGRLSDAINKMTSISLPRQNEDKVLMELEANAKPKPLITYLIDKIIRK